MLTVASDILQEARSVYLNDAAGQLYIDSVLLPHLKTAYNILQSALEANGVQCKNEEFRKIIPANTDELFPLPPDFVIPRAMYERQPNTNDEFRPMHYKNNISVTTPLAYLEFWTYRIERIFFLPSITDREIKLLYQKAFPAVNSANAAVFGQCQIYLAAKTAALALMFTSQSTTLAQATNDIAQNDLDSIINAQVKVAQTETVRRKGYLPFRVS